jgi:hypothetical protein
MISQPGAPRAAAIVAAMLGSSFRVGMITERRI